MMTPATATRPQPVVDQLTRNDERAAVAALSAAFAEYPLLVKLCPDAGRRPRAVEAFSRYLFRVSLRRGAVFATRDRAAVVCAWPPGREWPGRFDGFRAGGLSLLWRLGWRGGRLLLRLEQGFDAARGKHVPRPHWYVPLLGVRPESQGKGLSRAVLQPVFDAADRDKVPVYLETVPEANVAIYRKLGFTLAGFSELSGRLPNWEMVREPQ